MAWSLLASRVPAVEHFGSSGRPLRACIVAHLEHVAKGKSLERWTVVGFRCNYTTVVVWVLPEELAHPCAVCVNHPADHACESSTTEHAGQHPNVGDLSYEIFVRLGRYHALSPSSACSSRKRSVHEILAMVYLANSVD